MASTPNKIPDDNRFLFREAVVADIDQIFKVRFAVKENILSNPDLVTYDDNVDYLTNRGKGWVCQIADGDIVGFAIADLKGNSIWALFISPEFEGFGIGQRLQQLMLNWYFERSTKKIWLETAADTRAEKFYKSSGWTEVHRENRTPSNPAFPVYTEIKFEMTFEDWQKNFML